MTMRNSNEEDYMREWKCKCGEMYFFGSDPPKACQVCPSCGTTAIGVPPEKHQPTEERVIRDGKEVSCKVYCKVCLQRLDLKTT